MEGLLYLVGRVYVVPLDSVGLKKYTEWELWVKFYLGQNEGCSPGDISDSSNKLLQRDVGVGGEISIYVILVKEEYIQSSTYFFPVFC